jgi:histone deacetylase complex subunit SAP18
VTLLNVLACWWLYAAGLPPIEKLPPPVSVDREKTCPLLLRVFPKKGGHHK